MAANAAVGFIPGTPEWWMTRLLYRLMDRQYRYDVLESYVEGNHPLPDGDERFIKAFKSLQQKARTNYIGLITTTPVERMKIKNFTINGEIDEEVSQWWDECRGDFQSPIVHMTAASLGNCFVKVVEGTDGPFSTGKPRYIALDPRTTITEEDPSDPMVTRAALEMWSDDATGVIHSILHLQNRTYFFTGPTVFETNNLDRPGLTKRLLQFGAGGFMLQGSQATKFGVVPIVRFDWIPSFKGISKAEAEDVIDVQNRINSTILDRMVISRAQAYRQRYAAGVKIPRGKDGQVKSPFKPGPGELWVTDQPGQDVKFGEFSEADIRQTLEAIRDDVADMAAITKTPPHYLMGKMANVSGSTLDQAEAGMISKTKQRMTSTGTSWIMTARLTLLYMGRTEDAKADIDIEWYDPAYHSVAESSDALNKHVAAGVDVVIAAGKFGNYSPTELKKIAQKVEEKAALEKEKAEQDVALQREAMAAKAAQGNVPGGNTPR